MRRAVRGLLALGSAVGLAVLLLWPRGVAVTVRNDSAFDLSDVTVHCRGDARFAAAWLPRGDGTIARLGPAGDSDVWITFLCEGHPEVVRANVYVWSGARGSLLLSLEGEPWRARVRAEAVEVDDFGMLLLPGAASTRYAAAAFLLGFAAGCALIAFRGRRQVPRSE